MRCAQGLRRVCLGAGLAGSLVPACQMCGWPGVQASRHRAKRIDGRRDGGRGIVGGLRWEYAVCWEWRERQAGGSRAAQGSGGVAGRGRRRGLTFSDLSFKKIIDTLFKCDTMYHR